MPEIMILQCCEIFYYNILQSHYVLFTPPETNKLQVSICEVNLDCVNLSKRSLINLFKVSVEADFLSEEITEGRIHGIIQM